MHRPAMGHLQENLGKLIWDGISGPKEHREPPLGPVPMPGFVFWKALLIFGLCCGAVHELSLQTWKN